MKSIVTLCFISLLFFNTKAQVDWQIDMMHSYVGFELLYMDIIPFHGKFEKVEGTVTATKKDFSDLEIKVRIPATSISTGSKEREEHLQTSDFFDMNEYPTITFESEKVEKIGADEQSNKERLKITGNLTLRGVTKPIELIGYFTSEPVNDPWGHVKVGCSFKGQINRQNYGIAYGQVLESGALAIDNEVDLVLDIVLMRER